LQQKLDEPDVFYQSLEGISLESAMSLGWGVDSTIFCKHWFDIKINPNLADCREGMMNRLDYLWMLVACSGCQHHKQASKEPMSTSKTTMMSPMHCH
jgi:hypothetical protein